MIYTILGVPYYIYSRILPQNPILIVTASELRVPLKAPLSMPFGVRVLSYRFRV